MSRTRRRLGITPGVSAVLALLLLGGSPRLAHAGSTLETNVTGGLGHARNPFNKASQRKVVRTRIGSPMDPFTYVVYTRWNGGTGNTEVILGRSRTGFASDSEKLVLFGQGGAGWDNASDVFAFPALDISADGKQLHVVALNVTQADVVYTRNVSIEGAWATAWTQAMGGTSPRYDVVSTSAYATTAPSIALDENSRPHVVWTRPWAGAPFAPNVYYARHDGANWITDVPLSSITAGAAFPEELDPSIDVANGWVHVLYKDDQDTGDGTPKTDRYRYVRNAGPQFNYSGFLAAVTVMQPNVGLNDTGLPGSVAALGNEVWVTGAFVGASANIGYFNYSSTAGASWTKDGPGTEDDVFECTGSSTDPMPALIGLNSQGSDHRLFGIRRSFGIRYWTYQWRPATTTWVDGTCAAHTNYIIGEFATLANDSLHASLEKKKLPGENDLAYCWYNSNFSAAPALATDTIYCSTDDGPPPGILGPRTFHRSIGTRADYGTDTTVCPTCTEGLGTTVTAVVGSRVVVGSGTQWQSVNRGPGDVLRVSGLNYMVKAVLSDTELVTERPVVFGGAGLAYSLRRQETRLQDWANCIANSGTCRITTFDPSSTSLVADDRVEIGYAYDDTPFLHSTGGTGAGQPILRVSGTTTSATRDVTLTATAPNRHYGIAGTGVVLDNESNTAPAIEVPPNNFVRVEWLEVKGGQIGSDGIRIPVSSVGAHRISLHANLVHHVGGDGIEIEDGNTSAAVYNNFVYRAGRHGLYLSALLWTGGSVLDILANTFFENGQSGAGFAGVKSEVGVVANLTLRNTLSLNHSTIAGTDFAIADEMADGNADLGAFSSNNMSTDASAVTPLHCGAFSCYSGATATFVVLDVAAPNLHLRSDSLARGQGANLGAAGHGFYTDIDAQYRSTGLNWDIGADEYSVPTAVKLTSFLGIPGDGSVLLEWRTGSELSNLGFHVYRGPSADGPWTRLTASLIPGLGSSPIGQSYSWLDTGLANGVPYFYRLEDVDTASVSTFHGPVSATPAAAPAPPPPEGGGGEPGGEPGGGGGGTSPASTTCPSWVLASLGTPSSGVVECTKHGEPDAVSLEVVSRDARGATLELRTGGFWALHAPPRAGEGAGTVRVFVPGFDTPSEASAPALPLRRALVEAVVGKKVRLVSAEALDLRGFKGLRPSAVGVAEMSLSWDGTVRPGRRDVAAPRLSRGYLPRYVARLGGTVFQGETKSAVVEMTPVRFDGYRQQLVLAGRVRVRLAFRGEESGETGSGSTGRVARRTPTPFREVLAQLHTSRRGLHGVGFEDVFPARRRGLAASQLRLQRQGQAVGFRVEPATGVFGPGSTLFFFADVVSGSSDYSSEVAWELVRSTSGEGMGVVLGTPEGGLPAVSPVGFASFEANRIYQSGLLEAPDVWLWEALVGGNPARTVSLGLSGVETGSAQPAQVTLSLQGGSESGVAQEHHVQVSLNGAVVGEGRFAGKKPYRLSLSVPASQLLEGANTLQLLNVGDAGVYSLVFLDAVSVSYPQAQVARGGAFEGAWGEGGTAEVAGVTASPVVLDVTDRVKWVVGFETGPGSVRFRAEAGHRYVVVSREGLLAARVERPAPSTLRDSENQADYLVIGPRDFLEAAEPLLERRQSQGLSTMAVALEEIAEVFGHGQPSAEAIRDFIAHAFHSWSRPSPRYVVLLGDSSTDPRRFLASSWASPLPALWAKTSYLWTVSDPLLVAVNGTDTIPDLAIGRLPAQTPAEAVALVSKLLAWEDSGQDLGGKAVLVADDPDVAGDFEADVADIRASYLSGRPTEVLELRELGAGMQGAIRDAFDGGASLMSYVGHGGAAAWASELVWRSWDAPSLQAQSRQPLLLTMNCLNGYFVAPNFESLSEAMLKVEGRGAIAAFSPSGLSLDGPAHQLHRAVMAELVSGRHERLGEALLAAQKAYARTGLMPELLAVYQLLGDPAMKVR